MSLGMIDNYNFKEMNPMRYWAPPASWSFEKKKETTQARIFSGDWWGAEKKDGYFCKIVKDEDGEIGLYSRSRNVNGEYPEKHEWVPQLNSFFDWLPNGSCVLGELYLPSKPGSSNITTLLGCLKDKCIARQEKGEKLHLYVFDVLAFEGESIYKRPILERIEALSDMAADYGKEDEFVHFATYVSGSELWTQLQTILANGGEGMVITRAGAPYQPDKRPSKDCQKVKKELQENIDCFFTGRGTPPTRLYSGKEIETWKYWQNMRTGDKIEGLMYEDYKNGVALEPITKPYFHGWSGSLEIGVLKDGEVYPIGFLSGLADEIKADAWGQRMKCIEVTAMEILPTGGIRHAKLERFRPDLAPTDCTYEKYMRAE